MKSSIQTISIVGSGKVATQLGLAFKLVGLEVKQICSRTLSHAQNLAEKLESKATDNLQDLVPVDLVLVAVSDDAVTDVISKIDSQLSVAHTSGNTALQYRPDSAPSGVFYPLQTFQMDSEVVWEEVPICVEANPDELQNQLKELAKLLSTNVQSISSAQRKVIHLAAVWACNFSNHVTAVSEEILSENQIDVGILNPLLRQTFENILAGNPKEKQTGPAVRNDSKTLGEHAELMHENPEMKALYLAISNHIINFHNG